ncbi:MAG: hypothetical protein C5B54_03390 [Acidobacteria bacterium]|nr:MAG: hypothetical protein C5B54_03390 [Acidobacteriota bacterium]
MKTFLALAILLPVLAYHPHRPSVQQASSDDEMYEVYSVAIQDLFLKERDESKNDNALRAKLVVISDHTIPYSSAKWNDPTQTTHKWAKNGLAVDSGIVEDFKRKCKDSVSLEMRFTFPARQVLISDQEFESFFKAERWSWSGFYERYPNSVGYISLSRVGFNSEGGQALLYVARSCDSLCGSGYYVLVAKDRGAWSVKYKDMLWIS